MRAPGWCCGLLAAASAAGGAFAADEAVAPLGGVVVQRAPAPLWEIGLGAAVLKLPDYRGSDESRTYLLPLPYLVYRGDWLRADRDGARALLVKAERVKVDLSVAASVPTRSRDNAARAGMPNLPGALEVGPNVNLELFESTRGGARLDLRLPLRAAISVERSPDVIGTTFSPNLNLDLRRLGGWNVGVLGGPLFADRRYHERYYGVDAAYATPQRPAYRARGGYAGWRALTALSRRVGSLWIGAFVRYDSLRGAVFAASPLVRREHEVTAGIGVSWVFATSGQLVATDD
jgi:outer membrane scaffolding protein for murein synthesis (MipA/OmpV family)